MINEEKWIDSLHKTDLKSKQIDNSRWINTISKKNNYTSVKKYTLISIIFVCGLLLVSVVKNETRNLQKEINKLNASINLIKFNLEQALLDNEVITSPQNISVLAKEHLDKNLVNYKRSQILTLDKENKRFTQISKTKENNKNKIKNLSKSVKLKVKKKIQKKKTELRKLEEMYKNPETLPSEVKLQVASKIKKTKTEIKNIYNSPGDLLTLERVSRWTAVQVVKLFLGMPVVPGR